MKLTLRTSFLLGAALILLVNLVALVGVYLNRSGEPESRITLSERELMQPWGWRGGQENSGMAVTLVWRAARSFYVGRGHAAPDWLGETHLRNLGFDVDTLKDDQPGRRRLEFQSPRPALIVLELAGPTWWRALELAQQSATEHEAAHEANRNSKEFGDRAKSAREEAQREESQNSRLFAIDVGVDLAALRAQYPDHSRYMIVSGRVTPQRIDKRLQGSISDLSVAQINVPYALRSGLEQAQSGYRPRGRFEAVLAVGQRLEPWIESIRSINP